MVYDRDLCCDVLRKVADLTVCVRYLGGSLADADEGTDAAVQGANQWTSGRQTGPHGRV